MIPSGTFGETVDSIRKNPSQDFSNLMPRPGWKEYQGLGIYDL